MQRGRASAVLALALTLLCLSRQGDRGTPIPHSRMDTLPRLTVWAWERPTDLRNIDPATTAVAYLARTVWVRESVSVMPRRQPLIVPVDSRLRLIPVTRFEMLPNARLDDATAQMAADAVAATLQPGSPAVQIDFDARLSERAWYRKVLVDVRRELPPSVPLSITALASWCSSDRWMQGLPVDEAVPMYFRMEPDRRHAPVSLDDFRIREPLCARSVGVSTTEPWPDWSAGRRVYVFSDRGWHTDSVESVARRVE